MDEEYRDDREHASMPDPSALTTAAMDKLVSSRSSLVDAQLQIVDAKLDTIRNRIAAMDKATELFQDRLTQVPTDVDKQVMNLRELHDERFKSVQVQQEERFRSVTLQFEERDKRGERESRDNKVAVDAAFAAQKEAASEQNKSNTLAISKSELATAETILKLEQLVSANIQGLNDKVDDIKVTAGSLRADLTTTINSLRQEMISFTAAARGGHEQKADQRSALSALYGAVGALLALALVGLALYSALKP